jgi:hypothetical protein
MYSALPWIGAGERRVADARIDITDELLVAYVDDELDAAQRAMVCSVLDSNPALCRRADEMRLARDLLREAFPLRPDARIPEPIDAAANRLAEACARRSSHRRPAPRFQKRWKYATAAGFALCVAVAASYLAWRVGSERTPQPVTALTRIGPDTALHGVLESAPSAEVINVPAEDAAVRAVLTFRAKDGRFCREFEILAGSGGGSTGIACREHGEWRAEVMLSAAAAPPDSNYYTPAGQSDEPAVAEVAERLIQGDPLSAQEEASLLASGWRLSQSP